MTLDAIQAALNKQISQAAWAADNELRGEKVARFRRYVDGEHDAQMTTEMRKLLRIEASDTEQTSVFTSNQCDDVIQTMTDRLTVERIEGDSDAATKWADEVLDANRFDGLQMDLHEATLVDGDSYALVGYNAEDDLPSIYPELAWDGSCGILPVYKEDGKKELAAAIKVWNETKVDYADTQRVNVYYPDRIEKFIGSGDRLERYDDPKSPEVWPLPWVMPNGDPIGIPLIPFSNRRRGAGGFGKSELESATPLQDGLNRTLHSMIMASELSAFRILIAKGFTPPAGLSPGMIVRILGDNNGPLSKDQVAELTALEGSDLEKFIKVAEFFIGRIEAVTRTPNMTTNTNLSGEAMKQSEIKLLGKVRRFQVKTGNSWEDTLALAARVQLAFSNHEPPPVKRWRTVWKDPEIRNDKDLVDNVIKVKDMISQEESLRQLSPVFSWDEAAIKKIIADREKESQAATVSRIQAFNTQRAGIDARNPNPAQPAQIPALNLQV